MSNKVKIEATVISETEKAIKVELVYQHLESLKRNNWNTWLPKSQSVITETKTGFGTTILELPKWLADKIGDEIRATCGMCKHLGGNGVVYNF
ncbi:MAG: hypothetical protein KBG30_14625 [Bacteroidales bacterium]|nr:hypothetical protein [Saprospiraceae bacterium]MBP8995028.1 hypothetical protein [Bacteroidales bacterium]